MLTLGIETSCDETAAAVVENGISIRSNIVSSQLDVHSKYGGVVPELACRKHVATILPVIFEALEQAEVSIDQIDLVAATRGPGLVGALLVGLSTAKALAYTKRKPLVGVNHLAGHIYAICLESGFPPFPFVALVVSGGHTELYLVQGHDRYRMLGSTRDDAAGEAFDKVSKMMGLGYPGGPMIDRSARGGDPQAIAFPRAYLDKDSLDFSFSGLKTAVLLYLKQKHLLEEASSRMEEGPPSWVQDVAASFQQAVVDVLVAKTFQAARKERTAAVVLAGGVACNSLLRKEMLAQGEKEGVPIWIPSPQLCTDNAAMIASAAYFKVETDIPSGWPPTYLDMDAKGTLGLHEE